MISLYVGLPGMGKTYTMTERIAAHVSAGGFAVVNVRIHHDAMAELCKRRFGWDYTERQIKVLDGRDYEAMRNCHKLTPRGLGEELPVLLCVDEASEWLDAYDSPKECQALMSMFRQHRKVGLDILMTTQDVSLVMKRVRVLCEGVYFHRDLTKWRIPPGIPVPPPWRYHIFQVKYDRTVTVLMAKRWIRKTALVWNAYDTTETFRDLGLSQSGEQVDFRKAVVQEEGDVMRGWERGVLFGGVGLAAAGLMVSLGVLPGRASASSPSDLTSLVAAEVGRLGASAATNAVAGPSIVRVDWSWLGRDAGGWAAGEYYRVGGVVTAGLVRAVSERGALVVGTNGVTLVCARACL